MAYIYDEESVKSLIKWAETVQIPQEVILTRQNILLTPVMSGHDIKAH